MQFRLADDRDAGQSEGVEDFHGVGLAEGIRLIVVADQDDHGNPGLGEAPHAPGKGALPGGIGVAVLVDVAGEYGEVDIVVEGVVDGRVHRAGEIEQASVQAAGGVEAAVVLHAEMDVGEVQQVEHDGATGRRTGPRCWTRPCGSGRRPPRTPGRCKRRDCSLACG